MKELSPDQQADVSRSFFFFSLTFLTLFYHCSSLSCGCCCCCCCSSVGMGGTRTTLTSTDTHTLQARRPWNWFVFPGFPWRSSLVELVEVDICALTRRGAAGFIGKGLTPRHCPFWTLEIELGGAVAQVERTHPSPSRLLRDWPRWLWSANRVALVATAFQPPHMFPHLRWQSLRTIIAGPMFRWSGPYLLPSENAQGHHPVQVDATQCSVVVSRNTSTPPPPTHTHTHTGTRT